MKQQKKKKKKKMPIFTNPQFLSLENQYDSGQGKICGTCFFSTPAFVKISYDPLRVPDGGRGKSSGTEDKDSFTS